MDCFGLTAVPRCSPSADQPDRLLGELQEAHAALARAEHDIRSWRANSVTGNTPFRPRLSYIAHEALYEAGKLIDHIAEILRIEAAEVLANTPVNPSEVNQQ